MTENECSYWAFICYSRLDNCRQRPDTTGADHLCWGDWVHEALKTFSIPAEFAGHTNARAEIVPDRIDPLFQNHEEAAENANLGENIRQALEQSRYLIIICSPRSAQSLHVNEAVRYFKQIGRGSRILPLVIAGEPNAGDGQKPGRTAADECFVPALRHPVKPDGTLDLSRREWGYIFADARHGNAKRECLANDLQNGAIELETAKIQLIAGLIGVGFNGLQAHELKRLFAEAKIRARETRHPIQEKPAPTPEAQDQILQAQLEMAKARQQIQDLQSQAQAARDQARDALSQSAEARNQAQAAESRVLEAEHRARHAEAQLEEARRQVREAQEKVLEIQNLPPDLKSQLQAAQSQATTASSQLEEARQQVAEARQQARDAQNKIQEIQSQAQAARDQARDALNQSAEARSQAQAAENRVQEAEQRARHAETQLEDARRQTREAQDKILEIQNLPPDLKNQLQAAQSQAATALSQLEEARKQLAEARQQARDAQNKIQEIQNQTRDAQSRLQEVQAKASEHQNQALAAQNQFHQLQRRTLVARRLTKVFALLAVLAITAAGLALRQRKTSVPTLATIVPSQAPSLATTVPVETGVPAPASGPLNQEQIEQALRKINAAEQVENPWRSLDDLVTRIPAEQIPGAMTASSVILSDQPRRHFQEQLLNYWITTNWPAAFDWSCQLTNAHARQLAWEIIVPATSADHLTNTLARLNHLQPAPGKPIYTLLFQRWAAADPVQAVEQWQLIQDQDPNGAMLSAILAVWADQHPDAALNWLQSHPSSDSLPSSAWRNQLIIGLFSNWAAKDLAAASTACQQWPAGLVREKAWECILNLQIANHPAAAAESVKNLGPGDYRQNAIADLCRHWSALDAPAALAWAQSLPDDPERTAAVNCVVTNWARQDPPSAVQFARLHPELPDTAFGDIAAAWSKTDFNAATNWVENLPDGDKKDAALLALAASTEARAPKLAAKWATALTTSLPDAEQIQAIAAALAQDDLSNAVAWSCTLTNDTLRQAALAGVSETWAQHDPKAMLTYALSLPAGADQTRWLTLASRQLAARDLPATINLLQGLSDAALRQTILEQAATNCDLPHLDQAAQYIATMPAGDDQKAVLQGLLARWTPADPETALNWLCSFPATNSQPELVQSILKAWSQSEPAAAAEWLTNTPAGTALDDHTVTAFLEGTVEKYPEFAGQWTQSITNEAQRQKYQLQVARQWMKTDPTAALKWINTLNLPQAIAQPLSAR